MLEQGSNRAKSYKTLGTGLSRGIGRAAPPMLPEDGPSVIEVKVRNQIRLSARLDLPDPGWCEIRAGLDGSAPDGKPDIPFRADRLSGICWLYERERLAQVAIGPPRLLTPSRGDPGLFKTLVETNGVSCLCPLH
jgi:hypothetical protein